MDNDRDLKTAFLSISLLKNRCNIKGIMLNPVHLLLKKTIIQVFVINSGFFLGKSVPQRVEFTFKIGLLPECWRCEPA